MNKPLEIISNCMTVTRNLEPALCLFIGKICLEFARKERAYGVLIRMEARKQSMGRTKKKIMEQLNRYKNTFPITI